MPNMTSNQWRDLFPSLYQSAQRPPVRTHPLNPVGPGALDAALDARAKAATWGAARGYWFTIRADTGKPHLFKPGRVAPRQGDVIAARHGLSFIP